MVSVRGALIHLCRPRSIALLLHANARGSGGMPPPGKLGAVRLNLGAFETKFLVHLFHAWVIHSVFMIQ